MCYHKLDIKEGRIRGRLERRLKRRECKVYFRC